MKIIISLVSFIVILFIIKKVINIINSKIIPQKDNKVNIKDYNTTTGQVFKMSDVLSEDDLKNISSQLDNLSKKLNKKEN